MNNIGGEIPVDPTLLLPRDSSTSIENWFSTGRDAFRAIIMECLLKNKKCSIFLPVYRCRALDQALQELDVLVREYSLNRDLTPNWDSIRVDSDYEITLIVIINYFGLTPHDKTVASIRDRFPFSTIVLDNVQAPFSSIPKDVDYAFNSYRKAFGVPEGAYVFKKEKQPLKSHRYDPKSQSVSLRLTAGLVKHFASRLGLDEGIYLRLYEVAEREIDAMTGMKEISGIGFHIVQRALSRSKEIIDRRKNNAAHLSKQLYEIGIKPLVAISDDTVPLFVPVLLKNRDIVRRRLFEKRIYCPIHWVDTPGEPDGFAIQKHELSLVIDQRYDKNDMDSLCRALDNAGAIGSES